jgi:hypothetical protein
MYNELETPGAPVAKQCYGKFLESHRVKLFADGSLGAETAALSQPYGASSDPAVDSKTNTTSQKSTDDEKDRPSSKASGAGAHTCSVARCQRCHNGVLIDELDVVTEKIARIKSLGFRVEVHGMFSCAHTSFC